MRDSDTYLAILDEGRVEQTRKSILELGGERFGPRTSPPQQSSVLWLISNAWSG